MPLLCVESCGVRVCKRRTPCAERYSFRGINRKAQLKPKAWATAADGRTVVTAAQLVMKWGGELTPAGRSQSERLGERLRRQVYVPYTVQDDYGAGLLRLHSTFRHDFKVRALHCVASKAAI